MKNAPDELLTKESCSLELDVNAELELGHEAEAMSVGSNTGRR